MIAAFFTSLWGRIWPWVAGAGAALVAALAIWQSGKSAGRQEAETEVMRRDQQAKREADAVANEVDRLDDDSLPDEFDRLHRARRR
ncbi:hypothetical protein ACFO0J_02735 [Castellaniella hirudinis]|uniref:Uncharacterized protein n=1 Tax=Castellaniella hirudinis TaxID=1144617 RepID=A0ABV8RU57_9BURK